MEEILSKFAKNLRERRKALHMTQKELADKISYSEKAISKWESAAALPPSTLLPALSAILGVSIDSLLTDYGDVRYYLGIDGGGSKTEFLLINSDGRVLNKLILGPTNSDDNKPADREKILREGIFRVIGDRHIGNVSAYAGVSGSHSAEIMDMLSHLGFARVACGDSTSSAYKLYLDNEDGVLVNLGVGSLVFARYNGRFYRAGGYGYVFGDAASAFEIGKAGIRAALKMADKSGEYTVLKKYVEDERHVSDVFSCLYDFYRMHKGEIARYAPLVFKADREGDAVAHEIIRSNVYDLSRIIKGVLSDYRGERISLHICGGLVAAQEQILPFLLEFLSDIGVCLDVTVEEQPQILGAIKLAGYTGRIEL